MIHPKATAFFPGGLTLFLAGVFLSLEASRLAGTFSWQPGGMGIFIFLSALEMLCGFVVVNSQKRRSESFVHIGGALLLTLRAGVGQTALSWIVDFLLTGGLSAFLVRRRSRNTWLLFGAAMVLGLFLHSLIPERNTLLTSSLALILTGLGIYQARSLGKGRCFFLILPVVQILLWAGEPIRLGELLRQYEALRHTAVSTLPGSLLSENRDPLSVLQVTRTQRFFAAAPWKQLPYVGEVQSLAADVKPPLGYRLLQLDKKFDIVSLEILPQWHEASLRQLVRKLSRKVAPGGVLLVPQRVLKLLPAELSAVSVPGSEGKRFAAGLQQIGTSEQLDQRLQKRLKNLAEQDFMPPGVFTALFHETKTFVHRGNPASAKDSGKHSLLFWIFLIGGWFFLRLVLGRKGNHSAFLVQMDNYASCILLLLTGFCLLAGARLYSLLPEQIALWGLILLLPFAGRKGGAEKALLLVSLILPWLFVGMPEMGYFSPIVFGMLLAAALSTGVTSGKFMQESQAVESQLKAAAFCGIALGGLLFSWLFSWGNIIPVLLAASILRLSCLLRK